MAPLRACQRCHSKTVYAPLTTTHSGFADPTKARQEVVPGGEKTTGISHL